MAISLLAKQFLIIYSADLHFVNLTKSAKYLACEVKITYLRLMKTLLNYVDDEDLS